MWRDSRPLPAGVVTSRYDGNASLSLRQVDLQRTFTFRNSKQTYTGIPVIAANMDTTGTFEMARVLSKVSRYSNEEFVCLCFGPPNIFKAC